MSLELDKERFEEQRINGVRGYYDKVAKVFIPEHSFNILKEEILPTYKPRLDSEDISKSQLRVIKCLESKLGNDTYAQIFLTYLSHLYLLKNNNKSELFVILYVDLVGSTHLTSILSTEMATKLIRTFCQEMAIVVSKYGGYVLKYAGDAVIAFFPSQDLKVTIKNSILCAYNMLTLLDKSINEILLSKNLPRLRVRISLDIGYTQITVLGSEPDMFGHVINRTSKIMVKAKPNQIVIGDNLYKLLGEDDKKMFKEVDSYRMEDSNEEYQVYTSI